MIIKDNRVPKEHYFTTEYLGSSRFLALQAQIASALKYPKSCEFLEIGIGPGMFDALMKNFGYRILSVDYDRDLSPDCVGELPWIPIKPKSFDITCVFEVLEHLPQNMFRGCMEEIARITRRSIIISLPSQEKISQKRISLKIELGGRAFEKEFWRWRINRLTNPKEHYWEIENEGVEIEFVKNIFKEKLRMRSSFLIEPYFRFFIFDII